MIPTAAEVARYLQLPGRSADSRLIRLRAVYAAVSERGIGYAYDAPSDEAGRQTIRPPEQVLWAPRHATCLDLAVVLAGACLTAGLHPIIVVVDPPQNTGAGHALVLVARDPATGAPAHADPDVPMAVDESWAFVVEPDGDGATRLLARGRRRTRGTRLDRLAWSLVEAASLPMERKMLMGIRDRAERSVLPAPLPA